MKSKIMFLIGLIMLVLGIFFSEESNFMLFSGILGGGIIGYSSKLTINKKNS